jgi:general secretion pathway protein C
MQLVDRIVAPWRRPAGGAPAGIAGMAPSLVSLVFVVLLAAQLASLLWRALGSAGTGDDEAAPADVPTPAPAVDVAAIVNAHLFGVAPSTGDPSMAPATSANLALAGTLAGAEPEEGWAIIGANGQAARVYATGESLPGGAKLFAVYTDRVILDRAGARESLLLPRMSGAGAAPMARASLPQAADTSGSIADSVRQLLVQNPSASTELLRPQPVFAGGTLKGYRVYPGRNRAQFSSFGLQPGDLVMAVNGAPLDDPNRGLEILRGIGQGSAVTLTIDRGGQQQQLSIDPTAVAQGIQAQEPAEEEPEYPLEEEIQEATE